MSIKDHFCWANTDKGTVEFSLGFSTQYKTVWLYLGKWEIWWSKSAWRY